MSHRSSIGSFRIVGGIPSYCSAPFVKTFLCVYIVIVSSNYLRVPDIVEFHLNMLIWLEYIIRSQSTSSLGLLWFKG